MKQVVVMLSAVVPVAALAYYSYVVIPWTVGGFDVLGWFPSDSLMVGVWAVVVLVMSTAAGTLESRAIPVTVMSEGAWSLVPRITAIGVMVIAVAAIVSRVASRPPRP